MPTLISHGQLHFLFTIMADGSWITPEIQGGDRGFKGGA